jgi:hypothetical protein
VTGLAAVWLLPGLAAANDEAQLLLEIGDAAYARRAERSNGTLAEPALIAEAIDAYTRAMTLEPDRLEPRVAVLRALAYQGDHATADASAKREIFDRGRLLFEESVSLLGKRLGIVLPAEADAIAKALESEPAAGPLFYWGAVHWGQWGQHFGPLAAVKEGVAKKVRDCGEVARLLSPEYEQGGPYRLLGRLHAVAPRVPLFTMWIDHDLAIEYLEKAHAASDDSLTRMFLAEALLDHGPASERARAMTLLEEAAAAEPRAGWELEDARAIADAKKSLAQRR